MTSPYLVCLDIDGTTVDHDGRLHEPVREAVVAVRDAGHHVTLATGRGVVGTLPVLDALGLTTGYAVCANGAITLRLDPSLEGGYEVLEAVTFDPAPALRALREEFPTALVAVEELGVGFKVSAPFPDGELDGTPRVVPFAELMAHPVTRLTIRDPEGTDEDFLAGVERIGLHGVEYAVGWSAWLDITPEGVSKAAALEGVRRRLGLEPGATLAVGDQRNDLEMLRWAARGVAMGNAPDVVQAVADEVTGHVDDHGLVAVLGSLLPN
ncbi:HAD family phosphatase [Phycicoccus sp. CSK15P-2]|uniref:HAD family hydrolase n=1 Tax=Phycicoccus sp. CSK15P-2 TaxID=2807627 RepID=UPI0019514E76|nr:HAD family hydrolase [Phycicoccus sp. CSK15P-2]MBM6403403.1 HAD family phosphatase [Phycicoccus sp. CSK15P-2]